MFVETKREGEVTTDIWSVPGLVAWLENQYPQKVYCYLDVGHCLIAQYLKFHGWQNPNVADIKACNGNGPYIPFPGGWAEISMRHPRTFGAALQRAREFAAARS